MYSAVILTDIKKHNVEIAVETKMDIEAVLYPNTNEYVQSGGSGQQKSKDIHTATFYHCYFCVLLFTQSFSTDFSAPGIAHLSPLRRALTSSSY